MCRLFSPEYFCEDIAYLGGICITPITTVGNAETVPKKSKPLQ